MPAGAIPPRELHPAITDTVPPQRRAGTQLAPHAPGCVALIFRQTPLNGAWLAGGGVPGGLQAPLLLHGVVSGCDSTPVAKIIVHSMGRIILGKRRLAVLLSLAARQSASRLRSHLDCH